MNELVFIFHNCFIALCALGAAYLGKEALVAFISITYLMANLLVVKQINLMGYDVTSTDAFMIGSVLAMNLLNEYYGRASARKALWIAFSGMVFYTLLTQIHLIYLPSVYDSTHENFAAIFGFAPRIMFASLFSYFVSQKFENTLYAVLKKQLGGNYLILRNILSMSSSQLLDTILFSFLGLYGIVGNIGHIVFISFGIKLISIFIASPLSWLSKLYMHKEKPHESV